MKKGRTIISYRKVCMKYKILQLYMLGTQTLTNILAVILIQTTLLRKAASVRRNNKM